MEVGDSVLVGAAVPSLVRWGLSTDADLVFRTLASFGARDQRGLATELGLPARRIGDALAELQAAGAAEPLAEGRTITWRSRPVDEVVLRLRARRVRMVDRAAQIRAHRFIVQSLTDRLKDAGLPMELPAVQGLVGEHVRYLPSRALGQRRIGDYSTHYTGETLTINTEQVLDQVSIAKGTALDRRALAQGTRMRVLHPPPVDGDTAVGGFNRRSASTYRNRHSLHVPMKLFIYDRRVALLRADPSDPERGYFDITHPQLVQSLVEVFRRHWDAGTDPAPRAVAPISLSTRELELVNLLALGHTDVTAAEQLRITSRSVTNIMRRVMDRLGVENRFQLGLALGTLRATEIPSLAPMIRRLESG